MLPRFRPPRIQKKAQQSVKFGTRSLFSTHTTVKPRPQAIQHPASAAALRPSRQQKEAATGRYQATNDTLGLLRPFRQQRLLSESSVRPTADTLDNHHSVIAVCLPPLLIILYTYLSGATAPRIAKYVTGYQKEYPSATIVLIRTTFANLAAQSFATIRARLQLMRDVML